MLFKVSSFLNQGYWTTVVSLPVCTKYKQVGRLDNVRFVAQKYGV